ncbi:MAG: two-component regulator propeller domain-containing protein [Ferruginibacter sp.]
MQTIKKKLIFIYLLFSGITGCTPAAAQSIDYLFKHLTTANGLISNQVGPICQDNKGFFWIGMQTGLQRYDGKRFVTYQADVHDPEALHSDWISAIYEDSKKRLWIGTDQEGPYLLDRNFGKFFNYNIHRPAGIEKINGVWQFLEDSHGGIWVAGHNGYFKLNDQTNHFEPMDSLLQMSLALSSGIAMDHTGNLWFATTGGVKKLSVDKNVLTDKSNNPQHLPLFDLQTQVSTVAFDGFNNIWLSSGYERILYRYNFVTNNFHQYIFKAVAKGAQAVGITQNAIGQIFISNKGALLVSLFSRGIGIYNYAADSFNIINADNSISYGLHVNMQKEGPIYMAQDNKNNIWLGTDNGISIIDINKPSFSIYNKPSNYSDLLPSAEVSDILEGKDGDIYISYYAQHGGIVRLDRNLKFKNHYLAEKDPKGLDNQLWNLFQDKDGIIWSSNQSGSILLLNPVTGKFTNYTDNALLGNINVIQQDGQANIWIGHWSKGLIKIDAATKKIISYADFNKNDLNSSRRVLCFLLDDEKIWVGTAANGLQLFDKRAGRFIESFRLDEKSNHSISSNTITAITAYNRDSLLIGTQGGLNIFDKNTKQITAVTGKEGLPNNLVQAIALDDNKNIWVALYGGLSKINLHPVKVTNYDEDDGIINNNFNNHFYKLQDGRLVIGTAESFMLFDPATLNERNDAPDVTITGFRVFDKNILTDNLIRTGKELSLSYLDNSFHIEFASLQFGSANKIKYYYRLKGVDKNWQQADETQSVQYNQLQPGHYTFEVKCINRNGSFSRNITSLDIHIIPPFWKRWWFIALIVIALITGLVILIKWRENNFKELEAGKTRLQHLTAEKYKMQLESEQISHFFTTSLFNKNEVDEVLWDVAKNLIGKLGFVDCMIYLWNDDHTKLIQKAGYGPKGSLEEIEKKLFEVEPGQGVVGAVIETGNAILIPDTSKDYRYRADEMVRLSEICVPIKYNEQLLGVIDSEHYDKNFFTTQHLQALNTIATLVGSKLVSIEAEQRVRQQQTELTHINQQLAEVQLAALRSQMNPHFIFNALNSIKKFVIANEPANAEKYLGKFSKLIRSILDNSQSGMVTVEKELQLLTLYLDLEQLRFGSKLSYTISVHENINTIEVSIPSMLIQPFVENAMLHGIMHLEDSGNIAIQFLSHVDWLEVVITDNGIGRKRAALYKSNNTEPHHSIGISVATKRLEALKKDDGTPAGIKIVDMENEAGEGCGTKVIISIPI